MDRKVLENMDRNKLWNYELILASQSPRRRELLSRTGLPFEIRPASDKEFTEETEPWRVVEALAAHKAREVYEKIRKERAEACSFAEASPVACGTAPKPLFVIGADTIVVCDSRILGKPADEADAAEMLRLLSGRAHEVMTGVCLVAEDGEEPANRATEESTGRFTEDSANHATEEPANRATEESTNRAAEESTGRFISEGVRERIFHEVTQVRFRAISDEEIASYIATGEPMDKAGAYGIQGGAGIFVEGIQGEYNNVVGFPLARILKEIDAFLGAETVTEPFTGALPGTGERGEESNASLV